VVQERAVKTPFDMLEILAGCSARQRGPSKSLLCKGKDLKEDVSLRQCELGPPPAGAGCGLYSALYAVGLSSMMLSRFRSLDPYIAVLLLLAVLGRFEHPTMLNKDALAVIQSNP
jgi:hypothetical protein